jgi:hypothetical protein
VAALLDVLAAGDAVGDVPVPLPAGVVEDALFPEPEPDPEGVFC